MSMLDALGRIVTRLLLLIAAAVFAVVLLCFALLGLVCVSWFRRRRKNAGCSTDYCKKKNSSGCVTSHDRNLQRWLRPLRLLRNALSRAGGKCCTPGRHPPLPEPSANLVCQAGCCSLCTRQHGLYIASIIARQGANNK